MTDLPMFSPVPTGATPYLLPTAACITSLTIYRPTHHPSLLNSCFPTLLTTISIHRHWWPLGIAAVDKNTASPIDHHRFAVDYDWMVVWLCGIITFLIEGSGDTSLTTYCDPDSHAVVVHKHVIDTLLQSPHVIMLSMYSLYGGI